MSLLLELPPGGGTFTMARSMSAYLYKYTTNMDNFVLVCEVYMPVLSYFVGGGFLMYFLPTVLGCLNIVLSS